SAEVKTRFEALKQATKAVVIDEAHHAIADEYLTVLKQCGIAFRAQEESRIPLIGLTATPYRGRGVEENTRLATYFNRNLLIPAGMPDPIEELRVRGILSQPRHCTIETGRRFAFSSAEEQQFERFKRLPESFVRRIG